MTAILSSPMIGSHFITIDGLDGAGKSTLAEAAKNWFILRRLKIFDVTTWSKANGRLPTMDDIGSADVILTAEPSHVGIGAAIRNLVLAVGSSYNARQTAAAFALDRDIFYRQVILPFFETHPRGWILHERGLISSLAYQPLQSQRRNEKPALTTEEVLTLPGNQTALQHVPDLFVFLDVDSKIAAQRLSERVDASHVAADIFEQDTGFQQALSHRYHLSEVTTPWTSRGTKIVTLDGGLPKEEVADKMKQLLDNL